MQLQTERLTLMPCTAEEVKKWSYPSGPHIEGHLRALQRDSSLYGWGVWLAVWHGEVIGDLGFKGKPDEQRTVEVGYGLLPAYHGYGLATEAVAGLIRWAFATGEAEAVRAECLKGNAASIRVLEKNGFSQTGADAEMLYWILEK
ncbi:GNAT family N-acetyltransferase [Ectobacillus ponti]|uniref:GNAT family N-acetyltransferase n=1 Tax=Ectobacillus ponti TaxID=2961894 RepID=A0AA41X7D2_9BACI|nr:GNAT family N-acetyltransferase [Ectobacillus ponti]MCP8967643.1 GNAT family N-acetyltransferase [Ectobacillus ponti]